MYRLRLPLTQERQRVRNLQPNEGGGGGGSSPSSSPPPSDHPQNQNSRRRQRTRRVYVLQGPAGPPGRDGRDGINAPIQPIPQPRLNTTQLNTTCAVPFEFLLVGRQTSRESGEIPPNQLIRDQCESAWWTTSSRKRSTVKKFI